MHSLVAGLIWGVGGYLLGARALGPSIWAGVLVSPLVGVLVARLTQSRFQASAGWRRAGWALASVYAGAVAFGATVGVNDLMARGVGAGGLGILLGPVVTVLWGVTLTGFLLFLWPLAYATHWFLEYREA